ncbi:MAG: hypothetical protein IK073_06785 [Paludibacteraceae bacterium]|nr:hypothetical protein [Paludibacteraceae bacterium]
MKRLVFLFSVMCAIAISASAQRLTGSADAWLKFQREQCVFRLTAYGLYEDGIEKNRIVPQGKNANEGIGFDNADHFYQLNTLDGSFIYDCRINGQYLYLTNQKRVLNGQQVGFDPQYYNWIKLLWYENHNGKFILFTVDSMNTYRYFEYVIAL